MKETQFMKSRPALLRAWIFLGIAALLVSCGGATAPAAAPPTSAAVSPASPAPQPAALTYAFPDDVASTAAATALIKAYISSNPDVQISPQPLPAQSYAQQLLDKLDGQAPDVFVSTDAQAPALINRKALLDLQPLLATTPIVKLDGFQPASLQPWRREAALYGLPADVVPQVVFYNQDLFDTSGVTVPAPGWTWNDWLDAAKKLTVRSGGQVTRYGTALSLWAAMVWGNGGELVNADATRTLLDRPEATAGIQFAADMVNVHNVAPPPPDAGGPSPVTLFKEQGVAIMPGPSSLASELLTAKLPFKWGILPFPTGRVPVSPLSVSGLAVSSRSQNQQAALDFAAWVVGPEGNGVKASILPFAAPALQPATPRPSNVPGATAILEALDHGRTLPPVEQWPQIKRMVDEALVPVWQGKETAAAAYARVAPGINALLANA